MLKPVNDDNLLTENYPNVNGNAALKVDFLTNDHDSNRKVICEIEDLLDECKEFYVSVAFITKSGITPLLNTFAKLEKNNIQGKIITTDYALFTEPDALEMLSRFRNIEVKHAQGVKNLKKVFINQQVRPRPNFVN